MRPLSCNLDFYIVGLSQRLLRVITYSRRFGLLYIFVITDSLHGERMKHLPRWTFLSPIGLALSIGCSQNVLAQPSASELHNRATAAMCANCHGADGRTVDGSSIPALVGMPKEYMVRQLKSFKDGSRPATVMHQISKGLTDQQIDTLSTYYASLKR